MNSQSSMLIQKSLILVALWILFSAIGQVVMKKGLTGAHDSFMITSFADILQLTITYRYLLLGCVVYAISMLIYFIVLSENDINFAISIGGGLIIVLISLLAVFFLGEKISLLTWAGIFLVVAGICFIGISKQSI